MRDIAAAHILAIANQKGGVGKTTTTVNLAASLAMARKKVLLIDLDPQGNATMGSGVDKSALKHSVYDVLVDSMSIDQARIDAKQAGYHVLPANADATAAEVQLLNLGNKEGRLRYALADAPYDYIVIDCPPSLSMLTINALVAAHGVIIPMQCEYFALEGLSALLDTVTHIKQHFNVRLKIEGLLRTLYDPRNTLTLDVSAQLIEHFGDKVYKTVIPRNVRLAEAPSFGLPVLQFDRRSKGALAYLALVGEILRQRDG